MKISDRARLSFLPAINDSVLGRVSITLQKDESFVRTRLIFFRNKNKKQLLCHESCLRAEATYTADCDRAKNFYTRCISASRWFKAVGQSSRVNRRLNVTYSSRLLF